MDYLLAGAGVLAMPLTDHPDPIGVAAACLPVAMGVLYVLCAIGWVRRGVGWGPALLVGLFIVLSPAFHRAFQLGHPDHHALLELLFVVAIGAWVTPARDDGEPNAPTRRAAVISGLAIGLAIWVSAQSLLVWGAILVGVSYACLQSPPPMRKAYLSARLAWNLSVGAVVLAAVAIENWPDLTVVTIDKVSLIHLALAAMAFLAPGGMPQREDKDSAESTAPEAAPADAAPDPAEQRGTTRTIALLAALAAFLIWMSMDADRVLEPVSRPEVSRWHELVAELQPLYSHVGPQWSLTQMHRKLGYLPYALPLLLPLFLMSRRVGPAIKCTLGLLAPTLAVLTLLQLRWLDHYNLAVMPVAVIGLWEGLERAFPRSAGLRPVLRLSLVGILLGLLTYPACEWTLRRKSRQQLAAEASGGQVGTPSFEQALEKQLVLDRTDFVAQSINHHAARAGTLDPDRVAILSEEGEGPMLLYETGLPVVAAPYHRAIDGIVEAATFFAQRDPAAAREQLDRLRVRYVVMPARYHEQLMNLEYVAFAEHRSFDILRESIGADGKPHRELAAKPQVMDTMIFRMVMRPEEPCIPGVKLIGRIRAEDPTSQVQMRGLLYVVENLE